MAKVSWQVLCEHVRDEQVRVNEEYTQRINANIERRERLVKDFIDNVINPLLGERDLTASTCSFTGKKHKAARENIAHLIFFLRPTQDQINKLSPSGELLDLVAFDSPSLETFHEINEELGAIYECYTRKMHSIGAFRVHKYQQIRKKVEAKRKELEYETDMKERELEELKVQELQQASAN